jgi:hypothetical protein
MSQRPSLLDEGDFSQIGTKKSGGGGGGGDKSMYVKIGVLVGVVAIAGLVWAWPMLRPPPVARDSQGNPIVHEETEEDRQEFERQQKQIQMDVESGKATIGGA